MAATLLPQGRQRYYDDSGLPLAGGLIYTFAAGTSTPQAAFQDADGTVPHTNPIVLDAKGEAVVFWGTTPYKVNVKTSAAVQVTGWPVDNLRADPFGFAAAIAAIFTTLATSVGSSLVGFIQAGAGAIMQTVQDSLRERVSVTQYMSAAQRTDVQNNVASIDITAAVQKAIDYGGDNALIDYPRGRYKFSGSVVPRPGQLHRGNGATLVADTNVELFKRNIDGFPGRICFRGFVITGTGKTGRAIAMTNNTPLVTVDRCLISGFNEGILLEGSYSSKIKGSHITGNNFGVVLINESHATVLDNSFVDGNTYAGLCINGDPVNGVRGTNPIHNVASTNSAYQHSEFGIWAENCIDFQALNTYHEGNTKCDLRLGVADAGVYARACYNTVVDGWESSSACALGRNIIVEHAVNMNMDGLAFNAGTSSVASVLSIDGFSDLIRIDYHRTQAASIATSFSLPAARVIVSHNGRRSTPWNLQGLNFGTLGAEEGKIYGGLTSGSRPTLIRSSIGTNQDITDSCTGIQRFEDAGGNLRLSIDHVNSRTSTGYIFRPMIDNSIPIGEAALRWSVVYAATGAINTSDENSKQDIEPIPQAWLDAWADVQWMRFKFKDAVQAKKDGARWHIGLIAQLVRDAFQARGIDPFEIGLLCYDEWPETIDVDGNITPSGQRYGIRYDEALALECAYLRSKLPN